MTIEEMIKYSDEKAEEFRVANTGYCFAEDYHRKVAYWLTELLELRKEKEARKMLLSETELKKVLEDCVTRAGKKMADGHDNMVWVYSEMKWLYMQCFGKQALQKLVEKVEGKPEGKPED